MVFRRRVTYSQIAYILDMKCNATSTPGYTLLFGMGKINDLNLMLNSLLPDDVKLSISNDDFRLRSNLTTNETTEFTEKTFVYSILGVTQSH